MLYDLISHCTYVLYMRICFVLPLHILNIAGTVTNASGLNDICVYDGFFQKKFELLCRKERVYVFAESNNPRDN